MHYTRVPSPLSTGHGRVYARYRAAADSEMGTVGSRTGLPVARTVMCAH